LNGNKDKSINKEFSKNSKNLSLRIIYDAFCKITIRELENAILEAADSDERGFYRKILNLKLQTEQEKIVGERLV
jgi:hypothetical protein